MKRSIAGFLCIAAMALFAVGCGGSGDDNKDKTPPTPTVHPVKPGNDGPAQPTGDAVNKQTPEPDVDDSPNPTAAARSIERYYVRATVYAGATDYTFATEDGTEMQVRVNNLPEERKVKIPDNLLDPSEEVEGPPDANPALVGKPYRISYDAEDQVISIEGPVEVADEGP
ncbi:MAG: hypothetical protein AAF570_25410 [Bacteroidota bacterium]